MANASATVERVSTFLTLVVTASVPSEARATIARVKDSPLQGMFSPLPASCVGLSTSPSSRELRSRIGKFNQGCTYRVERFLWMAFPELKRINAQWAQALAYFGVDATG